MRGDLPLSGEIWLFPKGSASCWWGLSLPDGICPFPVGIPALAAWEALKAALGWQGCGRWRL